MNKSAEAKIQETHCPLCGQYNHCGNISDKSAGKSTKVTCWCMDSAINFPKALLDKVTTDNKISACICKACAQKHAKILAEK